MLDDLPAPAPELKQAQRHVCLLTGMDGGRFHWRLLHDTDTSRPAIPFAGTLDEFWRLVMAKQPEGYGAFVVVNEGGETDAQITRIRAVFIDVDGTSTLDRTTDFHAEPDFVVGRSDEHWHAYWRVDDMTVDQFKAAQQRLARHYGSDPKVSNPSRVMRLAGTLHMKNRDHPQLVEVLYSPSKPIARRRTADLLAGLPEVPAPQAPAPAADGPVDGNSTRVRAVAHLTDLVKRGDVAVSGQGGNNRTYQVACALRDLGCDPVLAHELLAERWNPHCLPPWDDGDLARFVENAFAYGQNGPGAHAVGSPTETFKDIPPADAAAEVDHALQAQRQAREQKEAADRRTKYRGVKPSELAQRPKATFWDIDKTLPRTPEGNRVIVAGKYSSHKTNLVLAKVLDAIHDHGARVLYAAGEASEELGRERIPAQCTIRGIRPADLDDKLVIAEVCPQLTRPEEVGAFIAEHTAFKPRIVVIDTLSEAITGQDENSAQIASMVMAEVGHIRRTFNATVVLVHHLGKDGSKGARGSSVFASGADAVWEVSFDREAGTVKQHVEKMRRGRAGFDVLWGTRIVNGTGDDGTMTVVPMTATEAQTARQRQAKASAAEQARSRVGEALDAAGAYGAERSLGRQQFAEVLAGAPAGFRSTTEWRTAVLKEGEKLSNGSRPRGKDDRVLLAGYFERIAWPLGADNARLETRWFLPAQGDVGEGNNQ